MNESWTVGELRAYLNRFPDNRPIRELYIDVEDEEGDIVPKKRPAAPPIATTGPLSEEQGDGEA